MARTILVVDDNPKIRQLLCEMFEREDGYHLCAEAANGQEAIALTLDHKPELIILDMSMPKMNGLEAAKVLKQLTPEIPIILFSLFAEQIDIRDVSVDRVVSKSEPGSLIKNVRSLIPA
jgi:CheY-like chemotaxis protein